MIFDLLSLVLIVLTADCCEFICACVLKFVGRHLGLRFVFGICICLILLRVPFTCCGVVLDFWCLVC